ncbi:ankyrin repeat-containing protein [Coniochaeta ligniaria NRRL 30616]|uniref:Ankyrin repeat-containing protein n=1 Tax=Coniochaeta ligniaria NRRL 30616 TaxID=1408157 RepID=A0A1J7JHM9_9PEZI|nr:ankyrin repeat-containing protein [Coniochaeta ligniaria NRRL 30616]
MAPNPYLLAADNPAALLELLREDPTIASRQDEHGYSLIHAAASYNHLDLLRTLVREYNVPVDLKDEDGETALFVVESVNAAKVLIDELGLDPNVKNDEGIAAPEKIRIEDEFPALARHLAQYETEQGTNGSTTNGNATGESADAAMGLPAPPAGLQVRVGTMPEQIDEMTLEVDPEFRRRIEELAAREDFDTPEGQARLRQLVEDTIADQGLGEERNVRPRQE